jgi:hypothetical protein
MNITSHGRLAKMDEAALVRIGRMHGFYTWPTTTILLSYWTFLVGLGIAAVVSRFFMPGSVREVVVITVPLLTLLLHVGMTYLVYRASDEYLRQRVLKCAAFAGAVLAFAAVADFCLERLGHPYLPMSVLNLCGWSLFIVLMLWVRHRAR